jgi:hypothetical protein
MLEDIEPIYNIDWSDLGIYIKIKHNGTYNFQTTSMGEFFIFNNDDELNEICKKFEYLENIPIDKLKEHIKPYFYSLAKNLGITHIYIHISTLNKINGRIINEFTSTFTDLNPLYLTNSTEDNKLVLFNILNSMGINKVRYIMYDNNHAKLEENTYNLIYKDGEFQYKIPNKYPAIIIKVSRDNMKEICREYIHNLLISKSTISQYETTPQKEKTVYFCSKELGIYGNFINPIDLFPLDMSFIISNFMNSATINHKIASQQMIIYQLQTENDMFKSKIKHIEDILVTNTELFKGITTYLSKKGGKKTRKIIKKYV